MPFTLSTDAGTLHGIIDLFYQDQSGDWHLLDWKTEWTPRAEIEENSQQHLYKMAAYAQAAQKSLQTQPEVVVCFLSPGVDLYQFTDEMIVNAWSEMFTTKYWSN
jgi:ATP-dependent exoDNAse (exonuclease V) beta subunit